jgi:hypothetical protein
MERTTLCCPTPSEIEGGADNMLDREVHLHSLTNRWMVKTEEMMCEQCLKWERKAKKKKKRQGSKKEWQGSLICHLLTERS